MFNHPPEVHQYVTDVEVVFNDAAKAAEVRRLEGELWPELASGEERRKPLATPEVIRKFLDSKRAQGLSPASIQSYSDILKVFARYYPILPSAPEDIERYLARFDPGKPTALDVYKVLNLMHRFAAERLSVPDPTLKVQKPRFRTKTPDRLTLPQTRMLMDAVRTPREQALVACFLGLGLRRSEARRLNIGDIGEDTILIRGKERTEPMPLLPEIRAALLKVADGRKSNEAVFVGRRGRLSNAMLYTTIKRLFERAGISGVKMSPHTLRHTRGALTAAAGLDSLSSKRLLRHRTTAMTDLYSQMDLSELRAKEERFNPLRLLAGQEGEFNITRSSGCSRHGHLAAS